MATGLKHGAARNWEAGLEVVPSNDPIAMNPDHSGSEVAPSTDPIVRHLEYSDIEVVGNQTRDTEKQDSKPRRTCGLRTLTFWLLLVVAIVVIAGAVGGGVGGSLATSGGKAHGEQAESKRYTST